MSDGIFILGEEYFILPSRFNVMVEHYYHTGLKINKTAAHKKWVSHFNTQRRNHKEKRIVSLLCIL